MNASPYDFDTVIPRLGTDAVKWSGGEDVLPMWVADMDFQTAPEILEAIRARADHGVFGYSLIPEAWYDAYLGWCGAGLSALLHRGDSRHIQHHPQAHHPG